MPKKKEKGSAKKKSAKKEKTADSAAPEEPKVDPEAAVRLVKAQLDLVEKAKEEHKRNTTSVLRENDLLQVKIAETERDSVEVMSYFKKEIGQREDELAQAKADLKEARVKLLSERDRISSEFEVRIRSLQKQLDEKTKENDNLQRDLVFTKEYRAERAELEARIEGLREEIKAQARRHEEEMEHREKKFLQEKMRLQQASKQQIAALAETAHASALDNLDATARQTFAENAQMQAALRLHIEEAAELRKAKQGQQEQLAAVTLELEEKTRLLDSAVARAKTARSEADRLGDKVGALEAALALAMQEKEATTQQLQMDSTQRLHDLVSERDNLKRALDLKSAELKRIKVLAKNLLDQRTEVEQFFIDSIDFVKREIAENRKQYLKAARTTYDKSMREGQLTGNLPAIRTFNKSKVSANSVHSDFDAAEQQLPDAFSKLELSELTWEQREAVLRQAFARINGISGAAPHPSANPPVSSSSPSSRTIDDGKRTNLPSIAMRPAARTSASTPPRASPASAPPLAIAAAPLELTDRPSRGASAGLGNEASSW